LALAERGQGRRRHDGDGLLKGWQGEGQPVPQGFGVLHAVTENRRGAVADPLQAPGADPWAAKGLGKNRLEQQGFIPLTGVGQRTPDGRHRFGHPHGKLSQEWDGADG
jgi:hypothetical protein